MIDIYENGILKKVLFSVYLSLIFISTFASISLSIDRAMSYFIAVAWIMGFLTLTTLFGITFFLSSQGFYPNVAEKTCVVNAKTGEKVCDWNDVPGEYYFSLLTLAGFLMLSMYIMPFIMRPLDYLANFKNYTFGFISYMLMMPVFTNVFQIYAMCNLHDVSWGNRPTSTGQEAFTANKKTQAQSAEDYKLFRTNFVFIWLAANVAYYILILELIAADSNTDATIRDSDSGYLAYFSIFLASLVLCRVTFASIHIIKWKFRYCLNKDYKIERKNLAVETKKLRKNGSGESTDEEELVEQLESIYEKNKDKISRMSKQSALPR